MFRILLETFHIKTQKNIKSQIDCDNLQISIILYFDIVNILPFFNGFLTSFFFFPFNLSVGIFSHKRKTLALHHAYKI